ncbi:unannotated protein [freshwater metagenome]|uniref:Unannotated protein n=1 Tax=freshwater metagenome TaxID=449393 RepID=A0A6J6G5Z7_9ZZZZ
MDLFVTSQRAELVDAGLHIVTSNALTSIDGIEVDLIDDAAIGVNRIVGHCNTEIALGFKHSKPQFPFENDFLFRRPQSDHLSARVTSSKNIGH